MLSDYVGFVRHAYQTSAPTEDHMSKLTNADLSRVLASAKALHKDLAELLERTGDTDIGTASDQLWPAVETLIARAEGGELTKL
jgi:hypothetical protein